MLVLVPMAEAPAVHRTSNRREFHNRQKQVKIGFVLAICLWIFVLAEWYRGFIAALSIAAFGATSH